MAEIPYFWRRKTWLSRALLPAAWLFGLAARRREIRLRRQAQAWRAAQAVQAKIVVVGNISLGGNGKTPVVIALARALQARGAAVAVISRGYGGSAAALTEVSAATDAAVCGDEPKLIALAAGCPVVVGRSRQAAAEYVLRRYPQTQWIISDDGLQHYALPRDAEWAVVAPDLRLGNGYLLPAGPLREPPQRLHRVDAVLFSGRAAPFPDCPVPQFCLEMANSRWRHIDGSPADLDDIRCQAAAVLTAIARPQRFVKRLAEQGIVPVAESLLSDHEPLPPEAAAFAPAHSLLLMTEKDAVKIAAWPEALRARIRILEYTAQLPPALLDSLWAAP